MQRGSGMSIFDRFKSKAEQFVGDAKEKIGELTGNDELGAEGKADQAVGEAKEAGHELEDTVTGAVEDVKGKLTS